ncbi:MAG: metallophosphoesterase [Bacteroidales bacterium]|nr:metallophosphoesterase [Bacteroidales bacterium]
MKFKSYVIFFLLFGVSADLYLGIVMMAGMPLAWKLLAALPTLAALVCLPLIAGAFKYTDSVRVFSYLTFFFEFPKFTAALFSVIGRYAMWLPNPLADTIAAAIGAGVALFFATMIFYVTRNLKVSAADLSFGSLPKDFDGLRICQLSDFHLGSFGRAGKYIRRIVETVKAASPDIILFTGDLVNFESSEADYYLHSLSNLAAPMGIFAVRGNHDYLLHGHHDGAERRSDMERLLELEKGLGWRVLLNENVLLGRGGSRIAIAGVENTSSNPYFLKMGGDLKKALSGLPEGIFKILLSHDPSHWRSEVLPCSDVQLTLSGHTHGLRYKMAGLHVSHWKLRESAGIYVQDGRVLHVSEGLGSAFAFRLGGFPKINLITLHTK